MRLISCKDVLHRRLGNPTLETLQEFLEPLGLRVSVALDKTARTSAGSHAEELPAAFFREYCGKQYEPWLKEKPFYSDFQKSVQKKFADNHETWARRTRFNIGSY
jgi:hypothetical protein